MKLSGTRYGIRRVNSGHVPERPGLQINRIGDVILAKRNIQTMEKRRKEDKRRRKQEEKRERRFEKGKKQEPTVETPSLDILTIDSIQQP
jgi:hypothetical protein